MILLNSTKSTVRFFTVFIFLLLVIIGGAYYYLTQVKAYQGGLNINKIEDIDTFYARYVYGDYYFRIIDYDQDRSLIKSFINNKVYRFFDEGTVFVNGYFSELIPVKLAMGYDFTTDESGQFTLRNFDLPVKAEFVTEVGKVSDDNSIYIDQVKHFTEIYAKILATQDQTYLDQTFQDTKKMMYELYADSNISTTFIPVKKSQFYEQVKSQINNLNINYYKLRYFKLIQKLKENSWEPNIAKWTYGDAGITLQYRRKEKNVLLRNLEELAASNDKEIIVNTISINNNVVTPVYLKINKLKNTISSYYMSKDGYLYVLKMKSDSKKTLISTMHDFMKISMGIYFNDEPTDKWFINKQTSVKKYYQLIRREELLDDLPELDDEWDKELLDFKEKYGEYPNKEMYEKLKNEKEKKSMKNKVKNYIYKIMD